MKILIYGDFLLDNSGFAKEIRNLVSEWLKDGHELAQVALNYDGLKPANYKLKIYPTRILGAKSHWAPGVLDYAIEDFQPDILISVGDYFMLPHITPLMSKPRKKPFKWVNWGVVDGEPMRKEYAEASGWAHHNMCQSKFGVKTLKEAQAKSFKTTQAETMYPPIDLEVFKKLNRDPLKTKFKTEGRFSILFVGRNQGRKNTAVLLEAIQRLTKVITNIQLVLHSTPTRSPSGMPDGFELGGIVDDLKIKDYVTSIKYPTTIPEEVMVEIYNAADCLCLPSMGEGFGLPIAEAMAVGIPVIGTNCSSMTELLADDRGMMVNPVAHIRPDGYTKHALLDPDDLANAIKRVWENPVLRKKMVKNSSKFIKDFGKKETADRFIEVFEKIIKEDVQPIALTE